MSSPEADPRFLDELPVLEPDEPLRFACHPEVPCFNACCRELDLELHPYDVLRLCAGLGVSSTPFLERYGEAAIMPHTGFPTVRLRMLDEPGRPCPFVTAAGCAVYADRPAACRCYPVGRGTRLDEDGKTVEHLCLLREPHCRGFEQARQWTGQSWLANQGLGEHAAMDDRYMALMARWIRRQAPLAGQRQQLVALAVYQLDRFGEFAERRGLLDDLALSAERRRSIETDEAERLRFALDWLELIIFGTGPFERTR